MLYIVSTPIGNLKDITIRAIETLKTVDVVLCEDTRVSKTLLAAYDIHTSLVSYHTFNEKKRAEEILDRLKSGQKIALISDAGTPVFQDPGFCLIELCKKENIPYTTIPGASSILSAIVLSGFSFEKFQFLGFLPKKNQQIQQSLECALNYDGLSVFFESPKRLIETLEILNSINPSCELCVIREITKKFEQVHSGYASDLLLEFQNQEPRGEIVLVIKGSPAEALDLTSQALELIEQGLSKKSAFELLSKFGTIDKDALYKFSK